MPTKSRFSYPFAGVREVTVFIRDIPVRSIEYNAVIYVDTPPPKRLIGYTRRSFRDMEKLASWIQENLNPGMNIRVHCSASLARWFDAVVLSKVNWW